MMDLDRDWWIIYFVAANGTGGPELTGVAFISNKLNEGLKSEFSLLYMIKRLKYYQLLKHN